MILKEEEHISYSIYRNNSEYHRAARTALDCLDIASEIVSFIDLHALLPVLLSGSRLRDAVRRILGPARSLTSDLRLFVSSVPLTQWAIGSCAFAAAGVICMCESSIYNKFEIVNSYILHSTFRNKKINALLFYLTP
jgi:hypothetical protein